MSPERRLDLVALILSVSIGVSLNLFTIAALVGALTAGESPLPPYGLSENATQILSGWGGGIIGVIGALVGIRVGRTERNNDPPPPP